jgi:hypothetical protein
MILGLIFFQTPRTGGSLILFFSNAGTSSSSILIFQMAVRVDWPIIDRMLMIEHLFISLSYVLHLE